MKSHRVVLTTVLLICCAGSDGEWIELTYTHGENYGHHCQQGSRTARIVFLCDTDIPGTVSVLS